MMFMRHMFLPESVRRALDLLYADGYEAFVVGGCVRDDLMGISPHDFDICTSAKPCEILEIFSEYCTIKTGIKHGTVTVLIDHTALEITTFRTEEEYGDSRHPDAVSFVQSFREDAARRDFTMNAIGYAPQIGFVDYYEGERDIQNKLIRTVGDPDARFQEDALRILRALRFSAVTGFAIEENTGRAVHRLASDILKVSSERIYSELTKLICGDYASGVIDEYFDVISLLLPELAPMKGFAQHNPHHLYDVLGHTLKTLEAAPKTPLLRWTMLFHDAGKPFCFTMDSMQIGHFYHHAQISSELANAALHRLRASNRMIERVTTLIRYHDMPIEPDRRMIKKRIALLGKETFFELLEVMRADCRGLAPGYDSRLTDYHTIENTARAVLSDSSCFTLRDLKINGKDLMREGIPSGPIVGNILNALLDEVLEEKTENTGDALMKRALEIARKQNEKTDFGS